MKYTKCFWNMFAAIAAIIILSCTVTNNNKQKPEDLSYADVRIEDLLLKRPHAQVILISHIPDGDRYGDSMVFEFQGSHLILKKRYFGNNPDDINFSERYYRNPEGYIDSITTIVADKPRSFLKNNSNLFYNSNDTNVTKITLQVTTSHFRYDPRKNYYYQDEKVVKQN
jgi:hypothetical protein